MWRKVFGRSSQEVDSLNAILDAQEHLTRIKKKSEEVRVIVNDLKTARERNHFSEQISIIKTQHA